LEHPRLEPDLVAAADRDDRAAREQLFAALYHELHQLAHRALNRSGGHLTISTTTLLHEAYLNVSGREGVCFPDRGRFLAYAARAIRGLIIDASRRRHALKRGGGFAITRLDTNHERDLPDEQQLTRLDEALEELAELDRTLAELVDLRYFCGLSLAEIAALRGVSERTMQREWEKARLLLFNLLTESDQT
jgi:RNA polymerase sigma factor (TIGR02999 family)